MKNISLLVIAAMLFNTSCKKDKDEHVPPDNGGNGGGATCNTSYLPIVMCHGLLASGDTYAKQAQRFVQNGQCNERVFVLDWNTLGGGSSVTVLDAFIDNVLQQTGATQVELVGHSAGGGLGYDYLADATRAAKVAHYVHVGSGVEPGPAGPSGEVPTMNIWSPFDAIVAGGNITGAVNVELADKDHYQVATSEETFTAMYSFFRGSAPASATIVPDGRRYVEGRALSLGENVPLADATINVYRVNQATGFRTNAQPDHVFLTDAAGKWGGFQAAEGAYYEFEVVPTTGRKLHYYREPFIASDRFVYLRSLPSPSSLAGTLLASLPSNDAQAVVVSFTANQAVINGRDDLRANAYELSTPEFASADNTTIAYFLYDGNNDAQTNGTAVGLFGNFPFLSGVDVFFQAATPESIELTFAGRSIRMRNWPSASEGITLAIFD
jgi:pimeloyl-ACP methyl ester carboxylesterase